MAEVGRWSCFAICVPQICDLMGKTCSWASSGLYTWYHYACGPCAGRRSGGPFPYLEGQTQPKFYSACQCACLGRLIGGVSHCTFHCGLSLHISLASMMVASSGRVLIFQVYIFLFGLMKRGPNGFS